MKPDWLIGSQAPRLEVVPEGDAAIADKAVEFCRAVGMTLYPWQEHFLRDMLLTSEDGTWSSREVVSSVPRQNGKGEILVARELVGIYLLGEMDILHSAHFLDTAIDAGERLFDLISMNPDLMGWWAGQFPGEPKLIKSNGKDAIKFPNGAKISFRTRTKKTARGLSFELVVFDECFDLPNEVYAAMNNTTKARPNAQKIFISSPVNRYEHAHGAVFSAKRWAAMDGAPGVMLKEWSPEEGADPFSREAWEQANPSLVLGGGHFGAQLIEVESEARAAKTSVDLREPFLVESLGIGNWVPRDDDETDFVPIIDLAEWAQAYDDDPEPVGEACIAGDVTPDGDTVALVAAERTTRGVHLSLAPVDVFDRDEIVQSISASVEANDPCAVVLDPKGTASTLVTPLRRRDVEPELIKWSQVTQATELFLTMFSEGKITHDGDLRWLEALKVAQFREGNANGRALTRKDGVVCQLVAATFAVWGLDEYGVADVEAPDAKRLKKYVGKARAVPRSRGVVEMSF